MKKKFRKIIVLTPHEIGFLLGMFDNYEEDKFFKKHPTIESITDKIAGAVYQEIK